MHAVQVNNKSQTNISQNLKLQVMCAIGRLEGRQQPGISMLSAECTIRCQLAAETTYAANKLEGWQQSNTRLILAAEITCV